MTRLTLLACLCLLAGLIASCSERERTVTVVFSNDLVGEIRSCGCAQKDYGGLGRRATFVSHVRKRADNVLLLEAGDFFGVDINYGKEKADLTFQALAYMHYDGMTLGEKDLTLGLAYLQERVQALNLPLICANLVDDATGEPFFEPSRIVKTDNGLRIGLIGVLGDGLSVAAADRPVRVVPPADAVRDALAGLADADLVFVLAHMPAADAQRLAREVPEIKLLVTGHDARPPRRPRRIGDAFILETSNKGRYMGLADLLIEEGSQGSRVGGLTYELEPLTPAYEDHAAVVKLFQSYDMEIANLELQRAGTHLSGKAAGDPFVGAEACRPCHDDIYEQWRGTKHSHAFEILENLDRQYDRDCTPCHTAGFYEIGGFTNIEATPQLVHVQCEACHGNGNRHARNPAVKTPRRAATACTTCHTEEQTPGFKFETAWPQIAH